MTITSVKRVLFVCTGNTCRSPMAEAMLTASSRSRGLILEVRSAGVSTMDGLPTSTNTASVLQRRDIAHHGCSRALDVGMVEWADLVLTMTTGHKQAVLQRFPGGVEKTYTLKEYVDCDDAVMTDIAEMETLYAEWQVKQTLGQPLTDKERNRLLELERRLPSFDIADPFGGSLQVYEACAAEIELALSKLLDKLSSTK